MDDFIDKLSWGLNAVFSNGVGYPRTRWLVLGGARDEQAFKDYLRCHQLGNPVSWAAYPSLTTANILDNAAVRRGLSRDLGPDAARSWLARLLMSTPSAVDLYDIQGLLRSGFRPSLTRPTTSTTSATQRTADALLGSLLPLGHQCRPTRRPGRPPRSRSAPPGCGRSACLRAPSSSSRWSSRTAWPPPHRSRFLGDDPATWAWGAPTGPSIDLLVATYAKTAAGPRRRHRDCSLGEAVQAGASPRATSRDAADSGRGLRLPRRHLRPLRHRAGHQPPAQEPPVDTPGRRWASSCWATPTPTACSPSDPCSPPAPTPHGTCLSSSPARTSATPTAEPTSDATAATSCSALCSRTPRASGSTSTERPLQRASTAHLLAAKMVGRWHSGAPLVLAPDAGRSGTRHRQRIRLPPRRRARAALSHRIPHQASQPARLTRP